jgi:hypothetical protein
MPKGLTPANGDEVMGGFFGKPKNLPNNMGIPPEGGEQMELFGHPLYPAAGHKSVPPIADMTNPRFGADGRLRSWRR